MKIATLTYQRHDNYGAMLQCYALQKKLEEFGVETDVIDYICEVSEKPFGIDALRAKGIKRYITGAIGAITRLPRASKFKEFRKLIKMTKPYTSKDISMIGAEYDGYLVGSDNVWNADITGFDDNYFLSFVFDKRKRASYAASFGSSKVKESHRAKYAELLGDFARVCVREKSGAALVEELTDCKAEVVCDPSLLLSKDEWSKLAADIDEKQPYILAYQMVPSSSFVKFVKAVAKEKALKVVYVPFPYGMLKCKTKMRIGPLEWLGLFKNAEFVITDSFHGCAFSAIFQREFCVRISQLGERIENILHILGIKNRIVNTPDEALKLEKIDYESVNKRLDEFRRDSETKLKSVVDYFGELKRDGISNPSSCSGCFLCQKVCPQGAINKKKDSLGFLYPEIDLDKCNGCKKCENVCGKLTTYKNVSDKQRYYSAINKDFEIIKRSGSGGVFFELAKYTISKKGVVYGAMYGEKFRIEHSSVSDITDVKKLMGTKYPQSTIDMVYDTVIDDLASGKKVLFVGTPCQCSAIKEYIKLKNTDDSGFYCCDLFCHGVFSPQMWSEYIEHLQSKFDDEISYISFRDKNRGWRNKQFKMLTSSKDISKYCNNEASVLRLYEQNIALRESCYQCLYMDLNRCGDISIGDFWGIERVAPQLDNNTGVSAVIVNTSKGAELFRNISDNMVVDEFDAKAISQQVLREPTKKHSKRKVFIEDYKLDGMEKVLNKYGRVKGKLWLKRNVIVPILYKLRMAGVASRFIHRND